MIIKVDHIAYSCTRCELPLVFNQINDYQQVFYEKNLPNVMAKKSLMKTKSETHDIILLNKSENIQIEITAYDFVNGTGKYEFDGVTAVSHTYSLPDSRTFYRGVGFSEQEVGFFVLKNTIDKTPFFIQIREDVKKKKSYYLDANGYCCIALVTNNADKEKKRLLVCGIRTTNISELQVNRKQLKIFFAYNECGDIIEFIQPMKQ